VSDPETDALAIFSPMPPSRSGIADYCCESLTEFSRRRRVTVVIDDEAEAPPAEAIPADVEVCSLSRFESDVDRRAVPRLYHLGNNPHHAFVYRAALRQPGTVVMHDYCLHHLVVHETLVRGDWDGYSRAMQIDQGPIGRVLTEHRSLGVFTDFQQFMLPLNTEIVTHASGVICHSRDNCSRLRDRFPEAHIAHIPLHYCQPKSVKLAGGRAEARSRLGIAQDELAIVAPGFITPQKQPGLLLEALAAVQADLPPFSVYLVGQPWDEQALQQLIQASGLAERVRTTGFTSETAFFNYIESADIVANLRYPSAGETSGTLIQALALGRCTVVFNYGSFSDFPNSVVARVPLDTFSSEGLAQELQDLGNDPGRRRMIEQAAHDYVPRVHSLEAYVAAVDEFVRLSSTSAS
jgi:glycosyltransferase involved in cell wall biosynthesis